MQTGLLPEESIDALYKQQDHVMMQTMQETDTRIGEIAETKWDVQVSETGTRHRHTLIGLQNR